MFLLKNFILYIFLSLYKIIFKFLFSEKYFAKISQKILHCNLDKNSLQNLIIYNKLLNNSTFFKSIILKKISNELCFNKNQKNFFNKTIIIFIGNNGVGKTTAISKISNYFTEKKIENIIFSCDFFQKHKCISINTEHKFTKIISKSTKKAFNNILLYINNYTDIKTFLIDTTGINHFNLNSEKQLNSFIKHINLAKSDFNIVKICVIDTIENNIDKIIKMDKIVDFDGFAITKTDLNHSYSAILSIYMSVNKAIYFLSDNKSSNEIYIPSQFNIISELNSLFQMMKNLENIENE